LYFVIVSEGLFFYNSESSVTLDQNATQTSPISQEFL